MKLTIDGTVYEIDRDRLMASELIAIERVTGMTIAEWEKLVARGSLTAIHALAWVIKKREEPSLSYSKFDFEMGGFDLAGDDVDEGDSGESEGKDLSGDESS